MSARPRLELTIEELILEGVPSPARAHIGTALTGELERLLGEGGVPPWLRTGGSVGRIDAGLFSVAPGADAGAIGRNLARAVYRGLGR